MKLVAVMLILSIAIGVYAVPMTGNYSIGGSGADFPTLNAALASATANGLSDDTYFDLNPGTYEGPFVVNIPDNTNTLYIRPVSGETGDVIMTNPTSTSDTNYILKIDQTSYIYIAHIDFQSQGTYSRAIAVAGNSDYLNIQTNLFHGVESTSTNYNESICFLPNGNADSDNVDILSNTFYHGGTHILASSYNSTTNFSNWNIHFNGHIGGYWGINLSKGTDLDISAETMVNTYQGIFAENWNGDVKIYHNDISAGYIGLSLSYVQPSTSTSQHVYNNVIKTTGAGWWSYQSQVASVGINANSCTNLALLHNSVLNTSGNTGSVACSYGGSNLLVVKNHFISNVAGYAVYCASLNQGGSNPNVFAYNNLFSGGSYLLREQNTRYHTVEEVNTVSGTTCYNADPFFSSSLVPSSPWLDNRGPHYGLTIDIGGTTRDASTPDIGAWEYSANPTLTPLSGNLSVGDGQTYPTLTALAQALALRGIGGAVTATLIDSLYTDQPNFSVIPGLNDYSIVIGPAMRDRAVLRFSDQSQTGNYVMKLGQIRNVIFRNISFETTATVYSNLVWLNGWNSNIDFQWCRFVAPTVTGDNGNRASLVSYYESVADDIGAIACNFYGNSWGIGLYGDNLSVGSCIFHNQAYGTRISSFSSANISGNGYYDNTSLAITASDGKNLTIYRNYISGSASGISLSSITPDGTTRSLIANNRIRVGDRNMGYGLWLGGSGIDVLNNSIEVNGTNSSALYSYQPGNDIDIVNNIFVSGQSLAVEYAYFTPSDTRVIDYNCYYSPANQLVRFQNYYTTLDDLRIDFPTVDAHSIVVDPLYTADMHSISPWLRLAGTVRDEISEDCDLEPRTDGFDIGADQQTGPNTLTPLNGQYTVGTPGDYPTIEGFIADLMLRGVSADVHVTLSDAVYPGNQTLGAFPTSDPDATVTIEGLPGTVIAVTPTYPYPEQNFAFKCLGADNVKFMSLTMNLASTQNQSSFIVTSGRCDNIQVENCSFDFGTVNGTAINTTSSVSRGLRVTDCTFEGGSTGISIQGEYYGTTRYQNVVVRDCTFNGTDYPISIQKVSSLRIQRCEFVDNYQAIALNYIDGHSEITRNKVINGAFIGGYSATTIVSLSNITGTADLPFAVTTNIIQSLGNQGQSLVGLSVSYSSHVRLDHNTIVTGNIYPFDYTSALSLYQSTNVHTRNCIFSAPATGYAVSLQYAGDNTYTFDSNSYYTNGRNCGQVNSTAYEPLDFIQNQIGDANGIFADPLVTENGTTTCSFLKGKAIESNIDTDINGELFSTPADLGATVIPGLGEPLAGSMTVGEGGDFADLTTALTHLASRGVSGDLILTLLPGNYNGHFQLGNVPNSLFHNVTITTDENALITGTATGSADNYLLRLNNPRNLTLSGLSFAPQNVAYSKAVVLTGMQNNMVIDSCTFTLPTNTQTSGECCAVYAYDIPMSTVTIANCHINNFAYGIEISGKSTTLATNTGLTIRDNYLAGPYSGIRNTYVNDCLLNGNTVTGYRYEGFSLSNIGGQSHVLNNDVSGSGYIAVNMNYFTTDGNRVIANNRLRNNSTSNNPVISLNNVNNTKVYFNTFVKDGEAGTVFTQGSGCGQMEYVNNIATGGSRAAVFTATSDFVRLQYNLFHATGSSIVTINGNNIGNLTAWFTATSDPTAIFADPMLTGDADNLSTTSPAIGNGVSIAGYDSDIDGNFREDPDMGCREFILTVLDTPQHVSITIDRTNGVAVISWEPVTGAGAYKVYKNTVANGGTWVPETTSSTSLQVPLDSGYKFFRVTAVDSRDAGR